MTKSLSALLVGVLLSTTCMADVVDLRVRPEIMLGEIARGNGSANFQLPEFEVFASDGTSIFHLIALPEDFKTLLRQALEHPKKSSSRLQRRLNEAALPDGTPYKQDRTPAPDFTFVEYWAEWCAPCKLQMAQVKEFLAEHPSLRVRWLKIERDPTKLEGSAVLRRRARAAAEPER